MSSAKDTEINLSTSVVSHHPLPQSHALPPNSADPPESLQLRSVVSLSASEFSALERLAFEHGQAPDSYLAIEPHRYCILAHDCSAAASAIVSGNYVHISGGILAPVEMRGNFIRRLSELAQRSNCLIACYSICDPDRLLFEDAGWEVTKFGEDTSLKLGTLNWSGKPFEWVRRQFNYCKRAGLTCREVSQRTIDPGAWKKLTEELFEIQQNDLKDRVFAQELKFLVGKLEPDNLRRRRLFIAEDQSRSRIEGFVIANPMQGGTGWAFEMFRKRQIAPRGTIPFLIKWAIDQLREEGVEEVSLCMLLWKGSRTFIGKRTSPLIRWGLTLGYHLGDPLYNTKGMTHFKTRFRPELLNCYVCVTPKATIRSTVSFFYVLGAFNFSLRNIIRNSWRATIRRRPSDHH